MRDEPGGLEEDGRGDGVIYAELDCEGAFAGEEVCAATSGGSEGLVKGSIEMNKKLKGRSGERMGWKM